MKKTFKKLHLTAESIYRLDSLEDAAGGFQITHTCSVQAGTCPNTFCLCPQLSRTCFC